MIDLYLRATDEAELMSALAAADLLLVDGTPQEVSHRHALVVIGAIPGISGYHANLRYWADFDPAPLAAVTITAPATPSLVWA